MRESIAVALGASLEDDPWRERPIAKIAAFCFASRTGTLLWRCKYANDRAAFKPAALLLARELPAGMTLGFRRKLAEQALKEWLFPICRMCFGAKEIVIDSLKGACPKCQGLGLYRYTDEERGQAIGVQNTRSVNRHFTRLATILSEIDRQVSSVVADQLERNL
jgi:hypothetical protein